MAQLQTGNPHKTRVLLLHNIVTPHMTRVFDLLGAMPGIELRVAYFAASEGDRNWVRNGEGQMRSDILPGKQFNLFMAWDYFSVQFNPGLRRWMREIDWDVLVNAGWASLSNWQAFLECRRQGKPHVLWSGSTPLEKSWRRTLTLPLVKSMVRKSDACVSYGTAAAEYLRRLGARSEVLPSFHCIDNDRFLTRLEETAPGRDQLRQQLGIADKRVVLFVGRLIARKGVEQLLSAFKGVSAHFPDVVLLIAGEGPMRAKLEAQASEVGKPVVFVGDVAPNDLPAYYGLADAFVIPSLEEVWGLVINEAALASLPMVVTSCCGAAADLVREDENGYLVPPGDVTALEKAMAKILADPVRARRMGEASRRLVDRCTPAGVASTLATAVRLAVASRRNS